MAEPDSPDSRLKRQFDYYRKRLAAKGVLAGTRHRRITIDKNRMPEENLRRLGFTPVMIAVPEAGQDQLTSFRHPENNFHIHSHPGMWTMHEDEHPAATMIMKSRPTLLGKAQALVEGVPHMVTEGVPGAAIYLANQAKRVLPNIGVPDMLSAIERDREMTRTKKHAFTLAELIAAPPVLGLGGGIVGAANAEKDQRLKGFLQGSGAGLGAGVLGPLGLLAGNALTPHGSAGPAALGASGLMLGAILGHRAGGRLHADMEKEAYERGVQEAFAHYLPELGSAA